MDFQRMADECHSRERHGKAGGELPEMGLLLLMAGANAQTRSSGSTPSTLNLRQFGWPRKRVGLVD